MMQNDLEITSNKKFLKQNVQFWYLRHPALSSSLQEGTALSAHPSLNDQTLFSVFAELLFWLLVYLLCVYIWFPMFDMNDIGFHYFQLCFAELLFWLLVNLLCVYMCISDVS